MAFTFAAISSLSSRAVALPSSNFIMRPRLCRSKNVAILPGFAGGCHVARAFDAGCERGVDGEAPWSTTEGTARGLSGARSKTRGQWPTESEPGDGVKHDVLGEDLRQYFGGLRSVAGVHQ